MTETRATNLHVYWYTRAFFLLLIVTSFQNFFAMAFAKHSPHIAQVVFVTKELYLFLVVSLTLLIVLATGKLNKELIVPFAMILCLLVSSVLFSPYFNFVSLRQALVLPIFIIFGVLFSKSTDINKIEKWVFNFFIFIVLLGLFERFVLYTNDETFFKALGVQEWASIKGWGYRIPKSWYSKDLMAWTGESYRRMPGLLIGDAVNFGQALSFPFIYAVIKRKYLAVFIIALALVFALSKGGILASIVGVVLYIACERLSKKVRSFYLGFIILVASGLIYISFDYLVRMDSVKLHYRGASTNLTALSDNLLGRGVGSAGNFAKRFNLSETSDAFGLSTKRFKESGKIAYGESYLGTMVGQFGLLGLLFYLYYPIRLLRSRLPKKQEFLQTAKYCALGLFAVGVFTETAFTYIGTGFVVALIPFVLEANTKTHRGNDLNENHGGHS